MVSELKEFLTKNKIRFKEVGEELFEIDGKTYGLSVPDSSNRFFDTRCNFVGSPVKADRYVYKFGAEWYWLNVGSEKEVKFNRMRWVGLVNISMFPTGFIGVHGQSEILNGSGNYFDWAKKAKFLGLKSLGICEKNSLSGVIKFQSACEAVGIKPIIGMEITVWKGGDVYYGLKCFAKDETGWLNLLSINKVINTENSRVIEEDVLFNYLDGVISVLDPKTSNFADVRNTPFDYYQFDTVEYVKNDRDEWYLKNLKTFYNSKKRPLPMCDAYYIDQEFSVVKGKLNRISSVTNYESHNQHFKDIEEYYDEVLAMFSEEKIDEGIPDEFIADMLDRLDLVCEEVNFKVDTHHRHLPAYKMTPEQKEKYETNEDLFWDLIQQGCQKREFLFDQYGEDVIMERIDREIKVIKLGESIDYFLILWDIVKWCRENGILTGIGRGSAGGSLVAYLLEITQLDPLRWGLLFERFLNEGRVKVSLPDIDTDFPGSDRNRVKEYMEQKYGASQVCSVGTYSALQLRAAIKDFSRLENIPFADVNYITGLLSDSDRKFEDLMVAACSNSRVKEFINTYPNMIHELSIILGAPKARSVHACAMMVFPDEHDMFRWCPIRQQDGQMVSEWEGMEMDSAGFLKEDILGVKQLDKFQDILRLIKENTGEEIDLYSVPLDDEKVFEFFQKGWNGDVFHFGSKGLTGYCKEVLPTCMEDLIAAISLYRPGAMENNFHKEYVLRKNGERPVEFYVGTEEILKETYGVFCYQEQIMKLCQVLGGLSLVEADDVRKAMVKKKYEALHQYKERFIPYYAENFGVTMEYSEGVWEAIDKAATYLFNKSHAAAYSITGYLSQWLKVHYPLEYWSVAFSYAAEDDYPVYVSEINRGDTGVKIMEVDINKSGINVVSDKETGNMYWALTSIKQAGEKACEQIFSEREQNGEYFSFEEFLDRHVFKGSKVNKSVIENLVVSGAFDNLEKIDDPCDRMRLIDLYRTKYRVKIDKDKDLFSSPKRSESWWWNILQKQISGYGWFDYRSIVEKFTQYDKDFPYVDMDRILEPKFGKSGAATTAGYVYDIDIKNGKNGQFCKIFMEHNYQFLTVICFPGEFPAYDDVILDSKGNILILNGEVYNDEYSGNNVMHVGGRTMMTLLKKD
jgi:DNA polymerase-3 subunit alpha